MQNSRSAEAIESFGLGTNIRFPFGVGTYVEVWGAAQRSSCLRGMTFVVCRDAGFPKRYQRGSLVVV